MKRNNLSPRWLAAAVTGLALAFSAGTGWAIPDLTLGTFDTDLSGYFSWGRGWGGDTAVNWDPLGTSGGSITSHGVFNSTNSDTPVCIYACMAGNPWWHPTGSGPFDLSQYKSIEFDLRWNNDPTNMPLNDFNYPKGDPASWGDNGLVIGAIGTNNANNIALTNLIIPAAASGAWVHVSVPIDPTISGLAQAWGVWIRKWICNPPAKAGDWQTGHVITNDGNYQIYLDNVVLKGGDILPPPTMSAPAKAYPGVNLIAASSGQYDRQEIRTVATNYSWIGASGPVTYSVDTSKIGENSPSGATLFFHWVPGGAATDRADSDWHEPNVMMWSIGNNANGGGYSTLRYKTNAPDNNGHLYDTGSLGGPGSASYKGTWSLTVNGNTSVTMTTPDGTTLTTNLPPEVITLFQATPGMQVNIGMTPGSPTRLGQNAVVSHAKITGTPSTIDSSFLSAAPDTNIWTTVATSPKGVLWVPSTSPYWLAWTLPATGFELQSKATLGAGLWNDPAPWSYEVGGKHYCLLSAADVPGTDAGYFRMIKRVASRLLVLLPGETVAPNTPTGKSGTAIPQTNSWPFDLTVMSVDSTFHPVSSTDTVGISINDPIGAINIGSAALVGGTATLNVTLVTTGSTITATNSTTPAFLPSTSSPVTLVSP